MDDEANELRLQLNCVNWELAAHRDCVAYMRREALMWIGMDGPAKVHGEKLRRLIDNFCPPEVE